MRVTDVTGITDVAPAESDSSSWFRSGAARFAVLTSLLLIPFTLLACSQTGEVLECEVHWDSDDTALFPHVCFLEKEPGFDLNAIDGLSQERWFHTPESSEHRSFDIGEKELWLKLQVHRKSNDSLLYFVSYYPWVDRINIFLMHSGRVTELRLGDLQTGSQFPLAAVHTQMPVAESFEIYFQFSSLSERFVGIHLTNQRGYEAHLFLRTIVLGSYQLLAALLFLLALILFFRFREESVAYYAVFLALASLYVPVLYGLGPSILGADRVAWSDTFLYLMGSFGVMSLLQFWRTVLSLKDFAPWLDRISLGLIVVFIPFLFLNVLDQLLLQPHYQEILMRWLTIMVFLWTIVVSVFLWRRRYRPALYYFFGATALGLSIVVFMFSGLHPMPGNVLTSYVLVMGLAADHILFMIAIMYRIQIGNEIGILREKREAREVGLEVQTAASATPGNRLQGLDVEALGRELAALLEEDKLYCDEDLSVTRLAQSLNVSRHQVSELIRWRYGAGFYSTVRRLRLKEACDLLREGDSSVFHVALAVGFRSKSTFNQEFKNFTGKTPTAYRRDSRHT